jgi:hypothetical protein
MTGPIACQVSRDLLHYRKLFIVAEISQPKRPQPVKKGALKFLNGGFK